MAIQKKIKFKKPYFENLDALRFLAAFAVFAFHFFREASSLFEFNSQSTTYKIVNLFISKGSLGVNFFFVLSGFLITYLILWERQQTGRFKVFHFLIRRTLRIWPLYFFIIILGFIVFPLILNGYQTSHSGWYYAFFLANFDEINVGLSDPINFLTAPWSVAVEEQFYLFWGVLLFVLHQFKAFKIEIVLVVLLVISILFSFIFKESPRILYYHTFSVMSNIVIGSALALFYFQEKQWLIKLKKIKSWKIGIIYLIGVLIILAKNKIFIGNLVVFEQSVISLFFAFIILDQIFLKYSFLKIGRISTFTFLGRISYGLYMYHLVVMYLITYFLADTLLSFHNNISLLTFLLLSVLGTFVISHFSFLFFEKPFLTLKTKFN